MIRAPYIFNCPLEWRKRRAGTIYFQTEVLKRTFLFSCHSSVGFVSYRDTIPSQVWAFSFLSASQQTPLFEYTVRGQRLIDSAFRVMAFTAWSYSKQNSIQLKYWIMRGKKLNKDTVWLTLCHSWCCFIFQSFCVSLVWLHFLFLLVAAFLFFPSSVFLPHVWTVERVVACVDKS